MKHDRLKTSMFKTDNGKNYRNAQEIDLNALIKKINLLGYNVLFINQPWRNVFAILQKNNKKFFFKMASTIGIAEKLKNEISWNEQINCFITKEMLFCIPKIIDKGTIKIGNQKLDYYMAEYFEGDFISNKNDCCIDQLKPWINLIISFNYFLFNIKNINFYLDNSEKNIKDMGVEFYNNKIVNWYSENIDKNLDELLKIAHDIIDVYNDNLLGVNHGDFVPWHIIKQKEKIIIIDGEHASIQKPLFYDSAYFYHRIYTDAENPIAAKLYLKNFFKKLDNNTKKLFNKIFRIVLATRTVGGFWDAKNKNIKDFCYHQSLKKDIIENKLL